MTVGDEVRDERRRLVRTLRAVGPAAPTLAAQWTAEDVAHHLAAQDRLLGFPAMLARGVVVRTNVRLTEVYLDRDRVARLINGRRRSFSWSLQRLDRPPPPLVLLPRVGVITLWEHFVHHEDLRRPNNVRRSDVPALAPVIEWLLRYNGPRLAGTRLRLDDPRGGSWTAGTGTEVTVRGPLPDLVLWLTGRLDAADVSVTGDPTLVDRLPARLRI